MSALDIDSPAVPDDYWLLASHLAEESGVSVRTLGLRDALEEDHDLPGYPVWLTPESIIFGPYGSGPCGGCLALRWQKIRTAPEREALEEGRRVNRLAPSPYLTQSTLEAARLICRWVLDVAPVPGRVHELDLRSLRVRSFPLLADPDCRVCGGSVADSAESAVITLRSRRKPAPGRYRVKHARDYGLDLKAFANPVCGMLGMAATPEVDCPTTAPVNGMMRLRVSGRLFDVYWGGHADSFDDSGVLGVFEGLERYAGGRRRRTGEPLVAALDEIREDALDPRECGVYSDEVYRSEPLLRPFDPGTPIPWVWGYSLRDERPVLVPERIAYYMGRHGGADNFVHECSNGCAGGGSIEEATLHGILELVERDAFLIGWYGRLELPEIDPATCTDRAIRFMCDRIRLNGYDVRLFDNRIDLRIPVVTAVAVRRDGDMGTLCFAAGAGLEPEDAVRAALCEVASYIPSLPQRVAQRRDAVEEMVRDYSRVRELADHATLFGHPAMAGTADFLLGERPKRSVADLYADWTAERPNGLNLTDDLRFCRDVLIAAGLDVIVVDQTSPEQRLLGLSTVSVIVPGLIPIDFGWSKQRALHLPRLRHAPRRAGLRSGDLTDADLHRVPHPFP
ncbi:TOMM precursor leader peptide-binding protein [Microbispora sp. NPDC088329]|uniref:TOMM precursor leader peptide-binding protein n=1 Tax=Microbispora sp. NPDC088329 TaxID=3154869 RepID=UPI003426B265